MSKKLMEELRQAEEELREIEEKIRIRKGKAARLSRIHRDRTKYTRKGRRRDDE